MNEDEAFIRAIVDNRGDETARGVYADWLDDQSDPRGPYLRAEAEWARTGKKEKALRELAKALDPVWVARISRPPVGICADKIAMHTTCPPATPADLDAVEELLKVKLPVEFRALLMNWNSAVPACGAPDESTGARHWLAEIESFERVAPVGTKRGHGSNEGWDVVAATKIYLDPQYLFRYGRTTNPMQDFIPLAYAGEGDFYMIGVRGEATGKIAYFNDFTHNAGDPDNLSVVFPSLGVLLASIIEAAPEWYRLQRNGETKALLAWIDAGGDVNTRHSVNEECPLSLAISAEDLSLVRELLARGAKVTRDIREMVSYAGANRKIRNAIKAAKPAKKKPTPKKGKKK